MVEVGLVIIAGGFYATMRLMGQVADVVMDVLDKRR